MARFNRFRRSYRNVRRFGFRSSAKYAYRKGGGSILFAGAGVAAGYAAPRIIPYQDMIMMGLAVLPGVLPMGRTVPWQLRRFASGYVLGGMARQFVPSPFSAGGTGVEGAAFV